jgi:hypothetical protein
VRLASIAALSASLLLTVLAGPAPAQTPEELIPFEKLDVGLRDELWKVTQRYTVRRKQDEQTVKCPPETYEWLLDHLPLASIGARELDLGKYVIEDKAAAGAEPKKQQFSIDDTDGAFANCEVVFREAGRLVLVARGDVEAKPLPKVNGTGVIVVRWKKNPKDEKQTLTDCHIFFRVASESLHRVSTVFRDTLGKLLGARIEGLVGCAVKVSELSEKDPDKVAKALEKSKKLKEDELEAFKKKFLLH